MPRRARCSYGYEADGEASTKVAYLIVDKDGNLTREAMVRRALLRDDA
jgi:hypothetical protein